MVRRGSWVWVEPGVKAEVQPGQRRKTLAELGVVEDVPRRDGAGTAAAQPVGDDRVRVQRRRVADAAEPVRRVGEFRLQHIPRGCAQAEVGIADDARRHPGGTKVAAGAHGGHAVGKFHLSHRLHGVGTAGPVHGPAIHVNRGRYVMTAGGVDQKIFQHVPAAGAVVPQVMMSVADRQVGLQRLFNG